MSLKYTTLGEYATIQGGYAYKSQDFQSTGKWPVLKIKNIKNGMVSYDDTSFVAEDIASATQKWMTKEGDVLISMTGSGPSAPDSLVGKVARVWKGEKRALINQRVGRLVLKNNNEIDSDFLFYLLSSKECQNYLVSNSTGSANQVNISSKLIESVKCPIISFYASKEIAEILKSLDTKIRLLSETNSTLESIAQTLFKSWFIDFDSVRVKAEGREPEGMDAETAALFPNSFEESEFGVIPSGWRVGKLSDLANLNPESWSKKNHPDKILYIDLANAKENIINEIAEYRIDNAPSRAKRVLRDGDTIVGTVRPGNRSFALIKNASPNLTGSTGFAVLRPSVVENTEFLYLATTTDLNIEYLTHIADGGAYPAVRPEVVINLKTIIPSLKIIKTYHSIVKPVLSLVSENQQQIQSLTNIRDTLLPKLISGQLCLNNEVLVS